MGWAQPILRQSQNPDIALELLRALDGGIRFAILAHAFNSSYALHTVTSATT
jgi:hypothetical protein